MATVDNRAWPRLFERLAAEMGRHPTGGEQFFLRSAPWAEEALLQGRDDRFLSELRRYREARDRDGYVERGLWEGEEEPDEPSTRTVTHPPKDSKVDEVRARVVTAEMARRAASSTEVRDLKGELFRAPTMVLSPSEAMAFITSPALQLFHRYELLRLGVRPLAHRATIVARDSGVMPWGIWECVAIRLEWDRGPRTIERCFAWAFDDIRYLRYPDPELGRTKVRVVSESYLDLLRQTAVLTAARLRCDEAWATWFLLTGQCAVQTALDVRTTTTIPSSSIAPFATIDLKVQPFVSPEAVRAAYSSAQRSLLGRAKRRSIEESNLALFELVQTSIHTLGARPPWRELLKQWNRWAPEAWQYSGHAHLRRDYLRTAKTLLFSEDYIRVFQAIDERQRERPSSARKKGARHAVRGRATRQKGK